MLTDVNKCTVLYNDLRVISIKKYKVIDLFSGAGGLSLGFMQTDKVEIVAAAEKNPNARKTYKRNFSQVKRLYSDVATIDYNELIGSCDNIDIVIGGPPCQGFSNANRQHTTIISMNNRLVKEYVRAICELKPKAFVMENVAMLRSQVHRFMVDETDLQDSCIMGLELSDDKVELLPSKSNFQGAFDLIKSVTCDSSYMWEEPFYKVINLLYRYRINQKKFDSSVEKYKRRLRCWLQETRESQTAGEESVIKKNDRFMAEVILSYLGGESDFGEVISAIEKPLMTQRAFQRMKELSDNNIHVYDYEEGNNGIFALVKSYAVRDYIKAVLESSPYDYDLSENTLNAINYGAPQRRERFIIVGIKKEYNEKYNPPEPTFIANFRTVRDAISDIQNIVPRTTMENCSTDYFSLPPHPNATGLEKELRGKALYNHIVTATREVAKSRFKALKEGQNFHDLTSELKTTYSNAERTQNTIYMRLKYDEPCGTVVNVRKSMWIHPELDRAISIREAARLQTFPDSFVFEGTKDSQYQQIGNAVPPFLAKAIAESVISILDRIPD